MRFRDVIIKDLRAYLKNKYTVEHVATAWLFYLEFTVDTQFSAVDLIQVILNKRGGKDAAFFANLGVLDQQVTGDASSPPTSPLNASLSLTDAFEFHKNRLEGGKTKGIFEEEEEEEVEDPLRLATTVQPQSDVNDGSGLKSTATSSSQEEREQRQFVQLRNLHKLAHPKPHADYELFGVDHYVARRRFERSSLAAQQEVDERFYFFDTDTGKRFDVQEALHAASFDTQPLSLADLDPQGFRMISSFLDWLLDLFSGKKHPAEDEKDLTTRIFFNMLDAVFPKGLNKEIFISSVDWSLLVDEATTSTFRGSAVDNSHSPVAAAGGGCGSAPVPDQEPWSQRELLQREVLQSQLKENYGWVYCLDADIFEDGMRSFHYPFMDDCAKLFKLLDVSQNDQLEYWELRQLARDLLKGARTKVAALAPQESDGAGEKAEAVGGDAPVLGGPSAVAAAGELESGQDVVKIAAGGAGGAGGAGPPDGSNCGALTQSSAPPTLLTPDQIKRMRDFAVRMRCKQNRGRLATETGLHMKQFLRAIYGDKYPLKAWNAITKNLPVKQSTEITKADFLAFCAAVNYEGDRNLAWKQLDKDEQGTTSLEEFDVRPAMALGKFFQFYHEKFVCFEELICQLFLAIPEDESVNWKTHAGKTLWEEKGPKEDGRGGFAVGNAVRGFSSTTTRNNAAPSDVAKLAKKNAARKTFKRLLQKQYGAATAKLDEKTFVARMMNLGFLPHLNMESAFESMLVKASAAVCKDSLLVHADPSFWTFRLGAVCRYLTRYLKLVQRGQRKLRGKLEQKLEVDVGVGVVVTGESITDGLREQDQHDDDDDDEAGDPSVEEVFQFGRDEADHVLFPPPQLSDEVVNYGDDAGAQLGPTRSQSFLSPVAEGNEDEVLSTSENDQTRGELSMSLTTLTASSDELDFDYSAAIVSGVLQEAVKQMSTEFAGDAAEDDAFVFHQTQLQSTTLPDNTATTSTSLAFESVYGPATSTSQITNEAARTSTTCSGPPPSAPAPGPQMMTSPVSSDGSASRALSDDLQRNIAHVSELHDWILAEVDGGRSEVSFLSQLSRIDRQGLKSWAPTEENHREFRKLKLQVTRALQQAEAASEEFRKIKKRFHFLQYESSAASASAGRAPNGREGEMNDDGGKAKSQAVLPHDREEIFHARPDIEGPMDALPSVSKPPVGLPKQLIMSSSEDSYSDSEVVQNVDPEGCGRIDINSAPLSATNASLKSLSSAFSSNTMGKNGKNANDLSATFKSLGGISDIAGLVQKVKRARTSTSLNKRYNERRVEYLKYLFRCLCRSGEGYLFARDFLFLKQWRPPSYLNAKPDVQAFELLQKLLRALYGGNDLHVWRNMDADLSQKVIYSEFEEVAREVGRAVRNCLKEMAETPGKVMPDNVWEVTNVLREEGVATVTDGFPMERLDGAWLHLDKNLDGYFTVAQFCPEIAETLKKFFTFCALNFGGISQFLNHVTTLLGGEKLVELREETEKGVETESTKKKKPEGGAPHRLAISALEFRKVLGGAGWRGDVMNLFDVLDLRHEGHLYPEELQWLTILDTPNLFAPAPEDGGDPLSTCSRFVPPPKLRDYEGDPGAAAGNKGAADQKAGGNVQGQHDLRQQNPPRPATTPAQSSRAAAGGGGAAAHDGGFSSRQSKVRPVSQKQQKMKVDRELENILTQGRLTSVGMASHDKSGATGKKYDVEVSKDKADRFFDLVDKGRVKNGKILQPGHGSNEDLENLTVSDATDEEKSSAEKKGRRTLTRTERMQFRCLDEQDWAMTTEEDFGNITQRVCKLEKTKPEPSVTFSDPVRRPGTASLHIPRAGTAPAPGSPATQAGIVAKRKLRLHQSRAIYGVETYARPRYDKKTKKEYLTRTAVVPVVDKMKCEKKPVRITPTSPNLYPEKHLEFEKKSGHVFTGEMNLMAPGGESRPNTREESSLLLHSFSRQHSRGRIAQLRAKILEEEIQREHVLAEQDMRGGTVGIYSGSSPAFTMHFADAESRVEMDDDLFGRHFYTASTTSSSGTRARRSRPPTRDAVTFKDGSFSTPGDHDVGASSHFEFDDGRPPTGSTAFPTESGYAASGSGFSRPQTNHSSSRPHTNPGLSTSSRPSTNHGFSRPPTNHGFSRSAVPEDEDGSKPAHARTSSPLRCGHAMFPGASFFVGSGSTEDAEEAPGLSPLQHSVEGSTSAPPDTATDTSSARKARKCKPRARTTISRSSKDGRNRPRSASEKDKEAQTPRHWMAEFGGPNSILFGESFDGFLEQLPQEESSSSVGGRGGLSSGGGAHEMTARQRVAATAEAAVGPDSVAEFREKDAQTDEDARRRELGQLSQEQGEPLAIEPVVEPNDKLPHDHAAAVSTPSIPNATTDECREKPRSRTASPAKALDELEDLVRREMSPRAGRGPRGRGQSLFEIDETAPTAGLSHEQGTPRPGDEAFVSNIFSEEGNKSSSVLSTRFPSGVPSLADLIEPVKLEDAMRKDVTKKGIAMFADQKINVLAPAPSYFKWKECAEKTAWCQMELKEEVLPKWKPKLRSPFWTDRDATKPKEKLELALEYYGIDRVGPGVVSGAAPANVDEVEKGDGAQEGDQNHMGSVLETNVVKPERPRSALANRLRNKVYKSRYQTGKYEEKYPFVFHLPLMSAIGGHETVLSTGPKL
eukprot:g5810.t1